MINYNEEGYPNLIKTRRGFNGKYPLLPYIQKGWGARKIFGSKQGIVPYGTYFLVWLCFTSCFGKL
jgi:hypothetical protein